MTFLIPTILSIWLAVKSGYELHKLIQNYKHDKFVIGSVAQSNQYIAICLGMASYGIVVPMNIFIGGFVFSNEWLLPFIFIDTIILYTLQNMSLVRQGYINKSVRFRDLFWLGTLPVKQKAEATKI